MQLKVEPKNPKKYTLEIIIYIVNLIEMIGNNEIYLIETISGNNFKNYKMSIHFESIPIRTFRSFSLFLFFFLWPFNLHDTQEKWPIPN